MLCKAGKDQRKLRRLLSSLHSLVQIVDSNGPTELKVMEMIRIQNYKLLLI